MRSISFLRSYVLTSFWAYELRTMERVVCEHFAFSKNVIRSEKTLYVIRKTLIKAIVWTILKTWRRPETPNRLSQFNPLPRLPSPYIFFSKSNIKKITNPQIIKTMAEVEKVGTNKKFNSFIIYQIKRQKCVSFNPISPILIFRFQKILE
jgi:hypothetical protein